MVSKLRVVVVGAGGMGQAWAQTVAAHPDTVLVGWVDLESARASEALARLGLGDVEIASDLVAALERLHPDFIVDATVPAAHHEVTATCLERRVAVLGEKPMAATMAEARDLVARAEATSTLFAVSQNRRYHAGLVAFRQLVATRLGGVGQLNAEFYRAPRFGGFRDQMASPLLVDMAIHTFDAARWVVGSDPVSVSCVEFNPPWSWYRGAASAIAEFEFDDGAHFSYEGSWCALGRETSWEASWRALGPLGSASWDGTSEPLAEVLRMPVRPAGAAGAARSGGVAPGDHGDDSLVAVRIEPGRLESEGIVGSLADFVRALRGGMPPMNECHDNLKSFAMVMAALEASRTGKRVAIEL